MKKISLLIIFIIFLITLSFAVPHILYTSQTYPIGNCGETDASDSLLAQITKEGSAAGIFQGDFNNSGSNQTIAGVFTDYCLDPQNLIEFTCGNSFGQQYNHLAGMVQYNCSDIGNYVCSQGACIQQNNGLPLVALWHFDEGSGTTTLDSSGNGNTGTINGATWTTGYTGNALDFDGNNDLVTTIYTLSIDVMNEIEIEAWVRHDALGYGTIVSKNGPYLLAIYNNKVHGGIYADNNAGTYTWTEIDGTTNLQVGTWYKLKMKYDGNTVKVFVNDIQENSAPKIGQMPQVSQNLNIGWGEPGQNYYFNGVIDEVIIRGY